MALHLLYLNKIFMNLKPHSSKKVVYDFFCTFVVLVNLSKTLFLMFLKQEGKLAFSLNHLKS